jgi:hypothetical protein
VIAEGCPELDPIAEETVVGGEEPSLEVLARAIGVDVVPGRDDKIVGMLGPPLTHPVRDLMLRSKAAPVIPDHGEPE